MSKVRRLALLTAFAAAIGGVAGVVSIVLRDVGTAPVDDPPAETVLPPANGSEASSSADERLAADENAVSAERVISMTQRIDSRDETERHALALELLRRGPAAIAQARALRPKGAEGRDLQARLVSALQKMRALRRGGDYARLEQHLRLRLDIDAFATVIPDERLREERLEYWTTALDAVRVRAARDVATDGEVALAELELARVRRELGRIDAATYAELAGERLPELRAWIDSLRDRRDVPPARVQALDEQAGRLEP